jgi:lipopolysaccharide transport system ATP-binding protein
LKDEFGNVIFTSGTHSVKKFNRQTGKYNVAVTFPAHFFNWGNIYIDLYIVGNGKDPIYLEKDILAFSIVNNKKEIGEWMGREAGAIHPNFKWYKEKR